MVQDLDWRAVRTFATVAESGGYTRAALQLGITQSAVSHAIRRLEEQLGCRLLYNKGKKPHLTPEGRTFLADSTKALDMMGQAARSVAQSTDGNGTLRLIFSASMAQAILAPVLREYRDCYPDLVIKVQLEDGPAAVTAVENGQCDLAIGIANTLPPTLASYPLFVDELVFALSPRHVWADRSRIRPEDWAAEHFIIYRRGSFTFSAIEKHLRQTGARISSFVEIPNLEVMKELIKLGLGVGLIAPWVMQEELAHGSLIAKPTGRPAITRRWSVFHQKGRPLRPSERTLIGLCRMAVQQRLGSTRKTRSQSSPDR